jgi:small subunit ribosomal protein S8
MHTDPISDMLTRIRNAQLVKKSEVVLPYSKIKHQIALILAKQGWIGEIAVLDEEISKKTGNKEEVVKSGFKQLKIKLLYEGGKSKISHIKRISKPGRRIYVPKDKLPIVCNNYGIAIISTSQGMMTNHEARKIGAGGEIVCEIF